MIAYTCVDANGFHGGLCVQFTVAKDEIGHAIQIFRSNDRPEVIVRQGRWTFYAGGTVVSEHNLDSLNNRAS